MVEANQNCEGSNDHNKTKTYRSGVRYNEHNKTNDAELISRFKTDHKEKTVEKHLVFSTRSITQHLERWNFPSDADTRDGLVGSLKMVLFSWHKFPGAVQSHTRRERHILLFNTALQPHRASGEGQVTHIGSILRQSTGARGFCINTALNSVMAPLSRHYTRSWKSKPRE